MATLVINRSSEYANALRNIKIFLDDKEIGTVANGEEKEFDIPEGFHTLQAKIDWCSSPKTTFNITSTGKKSYGLSSFASRSRFGLLSTIYYITFGTGRYLNLEEESA
jgi:hypothetical protein